MVPDWPVTPEIKTATAEIATNRVENMMLKVCSVKIDRSESER